MLKLVSKSRQALSIAVASPTRFVLPSNIPFSHTPQSVDKSSKQHSFTVAYLINSCGLSPENALSASRYVKFETPDKPDSVLALLKDHGFTQTQTSSAIKNYPLVLTRDPQKSLLPKLEFFKSKGLSITDIARISSFIFKRSLENSIIPSFNLFGNLLQSEEKMLAFIRRGVGYRLFDCGSRVISNAEILQEVGVPNANIGLFLMNQPRAFTAGNHRFRESVDEVKKMGFNPSKMRFVLAIRALRTMSKSTWEKKVAVYKKWGWTQDKILAAIKKHPSCMIASEDKINGVMDFLVNKMGLEHLSVLRQPVIISLSLQKRIVPRSAVYQALLLQGLIKASDNSFTTLLKYPEKQFLKIVLSCKKKEATKLLELSHGTLDLGN